MIFIYIYNIAGILNQKDPRGTKLSYISLSKGNVDVIVTDPDDGSDCWSLNRKIPARVGDINLRHERETQQNQPRPGLY